jgi:hypothetical protein
VLSWRFYERRLVGDIALLEVLILYLFPHVDLGGGLAAVLLSAGSTHHMQDLSYLLKVRFLAVLFVSQV